MQTKKLFFFLFSVLLSLASVCQTTPNVDSVIKVTISGISIDTSQVKILNHRATQLSSNPYVMKLVAREALRLSIEAEYPDGIFESLNNIGIAHAYSGDFQEAFNVYDSLLNYLNSFQLDQSSLSDFDKKLARTYDALGMSFDEMGDFDKAFDFYYKSLALSENINDSSGLTRTYNNLGKINYTKGYFDRALEYFKMAMEINVELGNKSRLFDSYNNIAGIYQYQKDYVSSLRYCLKALDLSKESNAKSETAMVSQNIGIVYQLMGKNDLALAYYLESLNINKENNFKKGLTQAYIMLSGFYSNTGEYAKSVDYGKKSLKLAHEIKVLNIETRAAKNLAEVYELAQNYVEALYYHKLYFRLNDSLFNAQSERKIAELHTKYKIEKKEQINKMLQSDLELKKLQVSRRSTLLIFSAIATVFLIILVIGLIRRNTFAKKTAKKFREQQELIHNQEKTIMLEKETKLQAELDHRNRELASGAMNLMQENEFINHITQELSQFEESIKSNTPETRDKVQSLINNIRIKSSNTSWDDFRAYFENVHSDFYSKLGEKYPDLSPNEKKLCAFLRLNLTTKEISAITFREVRSVESARNRFRKKLQLSPDVNLVTYLSQF